MPINHTSMNLYIHSPYYINEIEVYPDLRSDEFGKKIKNTYLSISNKNFYIQYLLDLLLQNLSLK